MLALSYVIRKIIIKYKNTRADKLDCPVDGGKNYGVEKTDHDSPSISGNSKFISTIDAAAAGTNEEPSVVVVDIENDNRETWTKHV